MTRILAVAFTTMVMFAASAAAQTPPGPARPQLKAEAIVSSDIVRIGDLVEHAGIVANVPNFRAPDLGSTGSGPVDAVIEAVRAHALIGLDTGGLSEVVVIRASRTIPAKQVEDSVAAALSKQFALGDPKNIAVNFERATGTVRSRSNQTPRARRVFRTSISTLAAGASMPCSTSRPVWPTAAYCAAVRATRPSPSRW